MVLKSLRVLTSTAKSSRAVCMFMCVILIGEAKRIKKNVVVKISNLDEFSRKY